MGDSGRCWGLPPGGRAIGDNLSEYTEQGDLASEISNSVWLCCDLVDLSRGESDRIVRVVEEQVNKKIS